jgi:heme-degrading monooxygenase HmoA
LEAEVNCAIIEAEVNDEATFLLISLWESWEAIRAFAGEDVERARYYPQDTQFLLELEPNVTHYEVLVAPGPATS